MSHICVCVCVTNLQLMFSSINRIITVRAFLLPLNYCLKGIFNEYISESFRSLLTLSGRLELFTEWKLYFFLSEVKMTNKLSLRYRLSRLLSIPRLHPKLRLAFISHIRFAQNKPLDDPRLICSRNILKTI